MAKRLIERMSSLIIDKECLESLIELVEYKIKQKLTPKQRRMLNKKQKKPTETKKTTGKQQVGRRAKSTKKGKNKNDSSDEDEENDEDEDDEDIFENENNNTDNESEDDLTNPNDFDDDEENDDDTATKTTETSNREDLLGNERILLKHIDDDGDKGLKLINVS
jgi:tRNA(Met) C34 N-acetyltransferase TmcA